MKIKLFDFLKDFFKNDISLLLTFGYIFLIFIGMIFNSIYFSMHHINIFRYSDITDFLLAPFRDIFILIFTIGSILMIIIVVRIDDFFMQKFPKTYLKIKVFKKNREKHESWFEVKGVSILIMIYIVAAAFQYAVYRSERIDEQRLKIQDSVFKDNKFNPTDSIYYLGNTNQYIFVKNHSKNEAYIIPTTDIVRLTLHK